MINVCLQKWNVANETVDLIASHGQTIYHAPKSLHQQTAYPNATLQIGDGDHIAVKTNIITISDFRQKAYCCRWRRCSIGSVWRFFNFWEARRK
jgi:anhydro-N-acetylmuramic acid kinase